VTLVTLGLIAPGRLGTEQKSALWMFIAVVMSADAER
jgi:hypothetical protein